MKGNKIYQNKLIIKTLEFKIKKIKIILKKKPTKNTKQKTKLIYFTEMTVINTFQVNYGQAPILCILVCRFYNFGNYPLIKAY